MVHTTTCKKLLKMMTDDELWQLCLLEEERLRVLEEQREKDQLEDIKGDDEFWLMFKEGKV